MYKDSDRLPIILRSPTALRRATRVEGLIASHTVDTAAVLFNADTLKSHS